MNCTNVRTNFLKIAQKDLNCMTFLSSLELQLMKLVNLYPVLVAKIPLVVMELVIKLLCFLYHTLFNTYVYSLCINHNCFPF